MRISSILVKILFTTFMIIGITACAQSNTDSSEKLKELEDLIQATNEKLDNHLTRILELEKSVRKIDWTRVPAIAEFSASSVSAGYQPITSPDGHVFYISLKNLSKHPNGYKATFEISNTGSVSFSDISLHVFWGANKNDPSRNAGSQTIKSQSRFLPGVFNELSVVLAPAKEEDLNLIEVMLTPGPMILREDPRK